MPKKRSIKITHEQWPIRGGFAISRGSKQVADTVTVTVSDNTHTGRGECVPYPRYGESVESVSKALRGVQPALEKGLTRAALQTALPPGAARNAIDCALWDLEIKQSRQSARDYLAADLTADLGLTANEGPISAYTISLDTAERMANRAREERDRPILKIKLGHPDDLKKLAAVREAAPSAKLVVDANEGWSTSDYLALLPTLEAFGVILIEQPFKAGEDAALASLPRPIPVCADESCHDRSTLRALKGRYDMINIKLDKTGGLTEAIALRKAALDLGFEIMIGCMVASSLAVAPAFFLCAGASLVDLDAPLLLDKDRQAALEFDGSRLRPPTPALWG